jgi:hypothetical protein
MCLFRRGDYRNKGHNHEHLSWVRVLVKMVSVARKLSTIEERRQYQIRFFRRGYYGNRSHNHEKSVLGSSPSEDGLCRSETKHDKITGPRPNLFVSARILQEQRPQPRKSVLGLSPGEDGLCRSDTKHKKSIWPRPHLFVSARILQ